MMYYVFVKDFLYGTTSDEMSLNEYIDIITAWSIGLDITIDGRIIPNDRVEAIRIKKSTQWKGRFMESYKEDE